MPDHSNKAQRFQQLREKAERMLDTTPAYAGETSDDVKRLLQELGVLHIELEMQHDELLDTQRGLEASRNNYVRLFDFAPVGYVVLDRQGLILDCNLAAATLFGARRHYLVNKPFMTYVHSRSQQTFFKHRSQAFDSSQPQSCELELSLREGKRAVVKVQSLVLPAEQGPATQCLTALMDITEQKELQEKLDQARTILSQRVDERTAELYEANQRLEDARKDLESRVQERTAALEEANTELRESEARLRTLFMTSPDSITLSRLDDGSFVDVNEGFTALSGYSREEALGQRAVDLGLWKSQEERDSFAEQLAGNQSLNNMQVTFTRKNGQTLQCLISARRLVFHGEEHILSVTRDISDLKRAEEKFRSIFKNSNLGIFRSTFSGRMLDVNPALANMLGYGSPEEMLAAAPYAQKLYADPDQRQQVLQELERSPDSVTMEVVYRRRQGEEITGRLHLRTVNEPGAEETLLEGFVEDISQRKRAEEALRRAEERYRLATAAGRTAVWQVDMRTGRVESEGLMERMLGLDLELHDLRSWERHLHPEDREASTALVRDVQQGRRDDFDTTPRFLHADGSTRWFFIQGAVIKDQDGTLSLATGTTSDVTEQQLMQEELRKAKEQADAASEAKSSFLANMSHEIRTPLGSIMGMTDLTLTTPLQEDQRKYITLIRESATSLLHLINDLLDISKIEAGKLEIHATTFPLRPLLQTCLAQFERHAQEKALELTLHVDPDVPRHVCGDPDRLGQVLRNLLSNALKFTEEGQVSLEVKPLPETASHVALCFSVSDSGIGIAPHDQPKLFKSFSQLERTLARKAPGSGLGLAISRELVQKMGGSIWLESEPGKGSTFHFTVAFQAPDQQAIERGAAAERARGTAPPTTGASAPLRLILAEDNPVNAEFLKHFLKQEGHTLHHVTTGREALDLWRSWPCDMVLMDIQMQDMDGLEATQAIRSEEAQSGAPATPIIALTAYAMETDRQRFLQAGMDACITKPVDIDELLAAIRQLAGPASTPAPSAAETAHEAGEALHFDDESARRMVKGSMEIVELLRQKYLYEAAPELLARLRLALEHGNARGLSEAAHSLKGSSSTICAPRARDIAASLEQAAEAGELESAVELLDALDREIAHLQWLVPQQ